MSNEKLLNAAKCQVYSFYCFQVLKGKQTERGQREDTSHTQIRINVFFSEQKPLLSLLEKQLRFDGCFWGKEEVQLFTLKSSDENTHLKKRVV